MAEDLLQKADRKAEKIAQEMFEATHRGSDTVMGWKSVVMKHDDKKYVLAVEAAWEKSNWYRFKIYEVSEPPIIVSKISYF